MRQQPYSGPSRFTVDVSRSHTMTQHNRYDSSGRVISPSQRPPTDNTLQPQQTDIHAIGGIRTHDPSQRAAADPRRTPRDYRNRLQYQLLSPTPNVITAIVQSVRASALRLAEPKSHPLLFWMTVCSCPAINTHSLTGKGEKVQTGACTDNYTVLIGIRGNILENVFNWK